MKSVRAIPHLIRVLTEDNKEFGYLFAGANDNRFYCFTPIAFALYSIGQATIPLLSPLLPPLHGGQGDVGDFLSMTINTLLQAIASPQQFAIKEVQRSVSVP